DDGDRAGEDRAGDDLLVEGPQVFERSAAAPDDHHVDAAEAGRAGVDAANRRGDLGRRAVALHADVVHADVHAGVAAADGLQDVADRRALDAGDDGDAPREAR